MRGFFFLVFPEKMEKNKKKGKKKRGDRERGEDRAHESVVQEDEEKDDILKMICCAYGLKMVIFGFFFRWKITL